MRKCVRCAFDTQEVDPTMNELIRESPIYYALLWKYCLITAHGVTSVSGEYFACIRDEISHTSMWSATIDRETLLR